MPMMLHQAFDLIREFGERAYLYEPPEARLVFRDQADQARFRMRIIADLKPADVAADPHMAADNHFVFAGIHVQLTNRSMIPAPRCDLPARDKMIAQARSLHRYVDTSSKLTLEDIRNLKDTLGKLLAVVGDIA